MQGKPGITKLQILLFDFFQPLPNAFANSCRVRVRVRVRVSVSVRVRVGLRVRVSVSVRIR